MRKILRLFVNTLTADDKCSLPNANNLTQPIQLKLSQKQKTLSEFYCSVFKGTLNFEHFPNKDTPHSSFIAEITDSQGRGQINV